MTDDSKTPEGEDPVTLDEPGPEDAAASDETQSEQKQKVWLRLLFMIIFAVLFGISETILAVGAVLQFGFLLFTGKRNDSIADFGAKLGDWMRDVARFQTAETEDKPFPFSSN